MRAALLLAALPLAIGATGGGLADDLWFFADFDGPARLAGEVFDIPLNDGVPVKGKFGAGWAFVSDDPRCEEKFWTVRGKSRLAGFPRERGTFACWHRSPEDRLSLEFAPGFGFCGTWKLHWVWRGDSFRTGEGREELAGIRPWKRSTHWRHFAATWNERELILYLDGRPVAGKKSPARVDMRDVENAVFRIGSGYDGSPAANLEMDEIAVFSRDLSADEVASLAAASRGILSGRGEVLPEHIGFPFWWRNQTNAEVRTALISKTDFSGEATARLGGRVVARRRVVSADGRAELSLPFDPSAFSPGRKELRLSFVSDAGDVLLDHAIQAEIFPRRERDGFAFFSWGGWKQPPATFLKGVGINMLNVDALKPHAVRDAVADGFFVNLRYENFRRGKWATRDVDASSINSETRRDFARYRGLHAWTRTLINSEVYGSRYPQSATNHPNFMAGARRALGFEPDFGYRNAPIEVNAKTLGGPMPRGIVNRGDCPQLDSLVWAMAKGISPYAVNRATAPAVHEADPQNIVWSEPYFEGIAAELDMMGAWQYDYSTDVVLWHLRNQYSYARAYGKPFQPTMDGSYYVEVWGVHPDKRDASGKPKKVEMPQSLDEITVRSWMSLGAVRSAALAFYCVDAWYTGELEGIVEPGTAARYGSRWRERIAPAADLLRDMPNERAKVAVVLPEECRFTSGIEWGQYHYPLAIGTALRKYGIAYDTIHDHELEAGALRSYPLALLPMANVLYRDHAAKLDEAAAAGCHIVTDACAPKTFAGGVRRDGFRYRYKTPPVHDEIASWYPAVAERLRKGVTAWSDRDTKDSYTFLKAWNGARYVVVVNDARSADRGFYGRFITNDWFRTIGAAQKIETRFRVSPGAAVYEFNADGKGKFIGCAGRDGRFSTSRAYSLAEGRVFCVYPRKLAKLSAARTEKGIDIMLADSAGNPAPGRQVVEVEVRDPSGRLHDESGRYTMENGRLAVPLRFAYDDPPRSSSSAWKASVRELTTGHAASCVID